MQFSAAAKKIAYRYLAEKIDQLSGPKEIPQDEFECWKGWHEDYCDFADWAEEQGYSQENCDKAWVAIQCLMGK